jgi:hypothetical protein
MALVFIDSFDPYATLLLKWSSGSAAFNSNPAFVRTGIQSLNPTLPGFGAQPRINFATRNVMFAGDAIFIQSFGAGGNNQVMGFFSQGYGASQMDVDVSSNGAIFLVNNQTTFATSAPGIISTGKFFYLEASINLTTGSYEVRVNGATVLSGAVSFPAGAIDGFFLYASPSGNQFHDDFYLLDDSGATNNTFLGAVQIFAILPDLNETPLQWTPLAGTNVSQVNIAPPPGDSDYVFDSNPGDIDQYHYTITGPSGSYSIKGIQHSLCARLDSAGSHTVNSQINGHTSGSPKVGSNAPGANYAYAIFPWDQNPNTSAAFQPTDFATTFVGPNLTS